MIEIGVWCGVRHILVIGKLKLKLLNPEKEIESTGKYYAVELKEKKTGFLKISKNSIKKRPKKIFNSYGTVEPENKTKSG